MRALTELGIAELRAAGNAIETVIDLRAYLPLDGMLVLLAGRFRDDIRELLEMPLMEPAYRGIEVTPLDELTGEEIANLSRAVGILLGRFTPFMDDPELITLLCELSQLLGAQAAERAPLHQGVTAS